MDKLRRTSICHLVTTGYTNLRQDLKIKVDLPAHYRLMQNKNSIMPELVYITDPLSGVSLRVKESVQLHFQRLIKQLGLEPGKFTMKVKECLDRSGRHTKKGMCKPII